jgi:hypothetical protein
VCANFGFGALAIYFYRKADTPGCTREVIDFSRLRADFRKVGTDAMAAAPHIPRMISGKLTVTDTNWRELAPA